MYVSLTPLPATSFSNSPGPDPATAAVKPCNGSRVAHLLSAHRVKSPNPHSSNPKPRIQKAKKSTRIDYTVRKRKGSIANLGHPVSDDDKHDNIPAVRSRIEPTIILSDGNDSEPERFSSKGRTNATIADEHKPDCLSSRNSAHAPLPNNWPKYDAYAGLLNENQLLRAEVERLNRSHGDSQTLLDRKGKEIRLLKAEVTRLKKAMLLLVSEEGQDGLGSVGGD